MLSGTALIPAEEAHTSGLVAVVVAGSATTRAPCWQCLVCGHVGCCDSSALRHASGHLTAASHPVMGTVEPGQDWRLPPSRGPAAGVTLIVPGVLDRVDRVRRAVFRLRLHPGRTVGVHLEAVVAPDLQSSQGRGVSVEVGERQAAVDLEMLVDYGVAIPDLARAVRGTVITAPEGMTGLEVVEVNISIGDVFLGDGHEDEGFPQASTRVR